MSAGSVRFFPCTNEDSEGVSGKDILEKAPKNKAGYEEMLHGNEKRLHGGNGAKKVNSPTVRYRECTWMRRHSSGGFLIGLLAQD